ncbi:hypothetical protein ACW4FP_19370 (plasmid) [Paenarthrobacter ureafaciens]|uniref:hypothetical protein n=1 Tax=Paenarthrobacter ureafaciens TaxID=37931 RepID=UPI001916DA04|nr:hypothetical protein [Paenarthrobacter ureafaciens]QQQ64470.1 hypothetical protein JHQ56_19640 [Paenarthrobacter ureafaciens]
MDGTEPSTDKIPSSISPAGAQLSPGIKAAMQDLAHHTGMVRIDSNTSTVHIRHNDGYGATYDLTTGQLLMAKRKSENVR